MGKHFRIFFFMYVHLLLVETETIVFMESESTNKIYEVSPCIQYLLIWKHGRMISSYFSAVTVLHFYVFILPIEGAVTTLLRGYSTPIPKLSCFVLYLEIIKTFLKIICASYSKLSKKLKNSIKI